MPSLCEEHQSTDRPDVDADTMNACVYDARSRDAHKA